DRIQAKLMGYAQPITGHVVTVTRGIEVSNAADGAQGLPNVDAVYTWVRLAQRIPVRIAIDNVPEGIPLVSGMTATVTVLAPSNADHRTGFDDLMRNVVNRLSDIFNGPPAKAGCIPAVTTEHGKKTSLPVEAEVQSMSPEQINPGLAPNM